MNIVRERKTGSIPHTSSAISHPNSFRKCHQNYTSPQSSLKNARLIKFLGTHIYVHAGITHVAGKSPPKTQADRYNTEPAGAPAKSPHTPSVTTRPAALVLYPLLLWPRHQSNHAAAAAATAGYESRCIHRGNAAAGRLITPGRAGAR